MSNVFLDNGSGYSTADATLIWSTFTNATVGAFGRVGGGTTTGIRLTGGSGTLRRSLAAADAHATLICGMALTLGATSPTTTLSLRGDGGATQHLNVALTSGSDLVVRRGTTVLQTVTGIVPPTNTTFYLELAGTLSDTVGSYTVWLNGVIVAQATNVDTKNAGTGVVFDTMEITATANANTNATDIYINNGDGTAPNTALGDIRVITLAPSSAGDSQQFTGVGDATNLWANVDEDPANTTDYNQSATIGAIDLFRHAALNVASGTQILAVEQRAYASKDDVGTRLLSLNLKSGGTLVRSADVALGTGWAYARKSWGKLNPVTGLPWTRAEIDALQHGYEVRA